MQKVTSILVQPQVEDESTYQTRYSEKQFLSCLERVRRVFELKSDPAEYLELRLAMQFAILESYSQLPDEELRLCDRSEIKLFFEELPLCLREFYEYHKIQTNLFPHDVVCFNEFQMRLETLFITDNVFS